MITPNPKTLEANNLMLEGTLAMGRAEMAGFRVDLDYVERKKALIVKKMERYEQQFKDSDFFKDWQKHVKGHININSGQQLKYYLYNVLKLESSKLTPSGEGSTDEESLKFLNIPEINLLLEKVRFKKPLDVLSGFEREQVDGYIHPFYNLHLVKTFRSCVAKGTKILVARDFLKYPDGVPIEEIKEGDNIYCFDDKLKPTIQKVLWAGKTGFREVVRVHYSMAGSERRGYVDVTPEHKIRLIDGSYEQAQNLVGDFRKIKDSKHLAKIRTLSCYRFDDTLRFTGHLKYGIGLSESHFIYSNLIGSLTDQEIVHHKNEIHLDHTPSNLEKTTLSVHSSHHIKTTLNSPKARRNNLIAIHKAREAGVYKAAAKRGSDCFNYLGLSKFTCHRLLSQVGGKLVKVDHDFNTFKKYLKQYNIDIKQTQLRYDKNGKYIWKHKLIELSELGRARVSKILGHNYYRLLRLYELYDLSSERQWGNQFGAFKPGNHNITKIEWLHEKVDVYDIEVEKYHNFFANEICVHNSSNSPNFQNIPVRDEEVMQLCRGALFPRPGHQLLEIDFKAIEVGINACYNKDATLVKYVSNLKSDMHGDMAEQIFKIDKIDKSNSFHKKIRYATKNAFVFPEFYGSYYKNCAVNLACTWGKLPQSKWALGQGIKIDEAFSLSDHLISKDINSFKAFEAHLKVIEKDFWEVRFPDYAEWKERWWRVYKKYGYFDTLTSFRCSGIMGKNDVTNYPAQGSAFHCLLYTLITLDKVIQKEKLDSRIIGQIHDSVIIDTHPDELEYITKTANRIASVDLPAHWKWIIVPMNIETELAPIDGSWSEKKEFKLKS